MAISSVGSYVTTADGFLSHGEDVNADRVANALPELALSEGYTMSDFEADRNALEAKIISLVGLENAAEEARDDRDKQKRNIRVRLEQFRLGVRLHLKNTTYFKRLPRLPRLKTTESKFLRPFDDVADLWARIDVDTTVSSSGVPMILTGGYTLAGFKTDLSGLRAGYKKVTDKENDLDIARKERDRMLGPLKERMYEYRAAIELEYGPEHPYFASMPEVTPSSGSTPAAVTASISWDEAAGEAVITWTASESSSLDHYEIRTNTGAAYDAENATVSGNVAAETLEFRTSDGLSITGDTASFRVYVMLTTGNEAGSNTVVITRP